MGCDIHIVAEVHKNGVWELSDVQVPDDRNYCTFAILADVRNGVGFAGVKTGGYLPPISFPRGIPKDASSGVHAIWNDEVDDFWLGDHSHSWLTLQELLAYPYEGDVTVCGMVSAEQAERFRATGETPKTWCRWTNQEGYEQLEWPQPLRESAWLFGEILNALSPLGNPEDVRIVFGFDS